MTDLVLPSGAGAVARAGLVSREQRDEIAERWLREYGEHTQARYRRDITVFFDWSDAKGYDVFAMLPWHVTDYAAALREGWAGELKASTRAGRISAVSSFFRFVQRNVGTAFVPNPAEHVRRPKVNKETTTRGLTEAELTALRAEALSRGPREYALVQLLAGTGMRISEAVGADARHLVRDGGEWYLEVKRKGREDRTPVQVPTPAVRALHRYLRGRKGALFLDNAGRRMSRQAASNRIRFMALAAGVKGKNITPHSLRHTATTLALSRGVHMRDVAALMDHSSMETTARYDRANRLRDNPASRALAEVIADDLPDVEGAE